MPLRHVVSVLALLVACGGARVAPPAAAEAPVEAPVASASAPASASAAPPEPVAPPAPTPHASVAVCPEGQVLGSDGTCRAPAPCLDGEEMMGACICPHGKTVDETGHCVFAACPKGETGGQVFRDETTGECLECRPGTVPCGDHCCPAGARSRSH